MRERPLRISSLVRVGSALVVRPLHTRMKKALFISLWALSFLVAAFLIWCVMCSFWKPPEAPFWTDQQVQQWRRLCFYGRFVFFGLPAVAVILGFVGVLPGTRTKQELSKV